MNNLTRCCFLSVAQFCKAVGLSSRLKYLHINFVKDDQEVALLGLLLLSTGLLPLTNLALPMTSRQNLILMFHSVANRRGKKELVVQKVDISTTGNVNLGPVVAELLRWSRVHTINTRTAWATHDARKVNQFWTQVSGVKSNLK